MPRTTGTVLQESLNKVSKQRNPEHNFLKIHLSNTKKKVNIFICYFQRGSSQPVTIFLSFHLPLSPFNFFNAVFINEEGKYDLYPGDISLFVLLSLIPLLDLLNIFEP